ncbi:dihydrofolate reductase [Bacillaceae bacterium Marseille-Q3522]|nr:dihydrofolate reductase [Bacillaceae bacterium Marseille-Q3522]
MISFLLAMDENHLIGKDNKLPWHLPADLQYFKRLTTGHTVVMGRKTFSSIGKPLPNRKNIVITRNKEANFAGCTVFHSIDEFIAYSSGKTEEFFVIGGAEIFRGLLPIADRLYITEIYHTFSGDTYFPDIRKKDWTLISREPGIKNEKNPYDYEFHIYERKLEG